MQRSHEVLQLACLVAIFAVLVCILLHLVSPPRPTVSPETFRLPVGTQQAPRGARSFDDGRRPVGAQIDRAVGSE